MSAYNWVSWLNLANVALGVVVLAAMLLVAYGLLLELVIRIKNRRGLRVLDEHRDAPLLSECVRATRMPDNAMT